MHNPNEAPASYTDRFASTIPDTADGVGQHRRQVAGMVSALDEAVGNVSAALRRAGMGGTTLIVYSSDNGAAAAAENYNMGSNWPLRGMKRTLFEARVLI